MLPEGLKYVSFPKFILYHILTVIRCIFHILLYSNLLALYVFLAIHVLLSLTLILWKLIPLSFIYNSLLPLTFFKQLQDAAANSFFFFFTWIPVLGYRTLREESMEKKFRAGFSPRAMMLGNHFLVHVLWRQYLLLYEFLLNQME